MKTVRNIAIGMVIATLMLVMLATSASALTANLFTDQEDYGWDYTAKDQNGNNLTGNGVAGSSCLVQTIRDNSKNGISPPDPSDPSKCSDPDDEVLDVMYIGQGGYAPDTGEFYDVYGGATELFEGQRLYCRAWNGFSLKEATHYGDSHYGVDMLLGTHDYNMVSGGIDGGIPPTAYLWWTNESKPTVSKNVPMKAGWNLISLCFEPSDNSTSAVLSSIWANVSEVKEWNAVSKTWADVMSGKMDRDGTGYFVYVTTACTWEHTGAKNTASMTIPLETGLNLVGYPFDKTISTGDALAGLNYYYAAPFNASLQRYNETYNPAAPDPFNDFTTINPCEGFWVSSRDGGDWTAA